MRSLLGRFHRPMSRGLVNNMLTMNNLGDGSTLSLDFTTGVLDPRLTFTRSTTATYIPSSGYVTSAAINAPRFDYSPTNIGEPRGLLIEGQTANRTKYSEAFTNAYWNTTANNVTAADSVATSPTGVALTASTLTEIAGTGSHHVHQLVGEFTPAASTAYTMSCFVKQPTSNAIRYVQLAFWSAGFGLTAYMNYDLQTGTVGTGGAGITASSITAYPNGWYRITATATSVAVPGVSGFQLGFSTTSGAVRTESYTASAPLKSIQLFGAQVEVGSGASSYIPTGASQVTRELDSCVMTGTNFSSWFAGATEGVLFAQYEKQRSQSGNAAHDYCAVGSRYNPGEGLILYNGNTNFYPTAILWPTGGAIFAGGIATAIPSVTKQAAKWFAANDITMYSNGVVGTTGVGTGTVTPAMLSFGANSNTGTEATRDWLNACVRRVKFYPTALSDAAIQTLTTP